MIADREYFVIELAEGGFIDDIFDDARDLYLEIGSGKGEFISQYPINHSRWNFIGIKKSEKTAGLSPHFMLYKRI